MPDGEFLAYAASLAAGGVLLLILAVLGLGQGWTLRAVEVLVGLAFLGYAGYLMVVTPESPSMSWFVLVTPVLGLAVAAVARRRSRAKVKRLAENSGPQPYAGHDAKGHAERQPFPTPPGPLDVSVRHSDEPVSAPADSAEKPSRLSAAPPESLSAAPPESGLRGSPVEPPSRPKRPSGLPQTHAEPDYRAKHEAANEATAQHDSAGGKHRADGADARS